MSKQVEEKANTPFVQLQNIDIQKKTIIKPETIKPSSGNKIRERKMGDFFIGRRKTAIAQIRLQKGDGQIIINKRPFETYFSAKHMQQKVLHPFIITKSESTYDMHVTVKGSGLSAQSEAIRTALSRCLDQFYPDFHTEIKKLGYLTMDSRRVERKKYGLKKARKGSQFSKR